MAKAIKRKGRGKGTPNKSTAYIRDRQLTVKASEGFIESLNALQEVYPTKSRMDFLHEALQAYCMKHLSERQHIYYVNRIL